MAVKMDPIHQFELKPIFTLPTSMSFSSTVFAGCAPPGSRTSITTGSNAGYFSQICKTATKPAR